MQCPIQAPEHAEMLLAYCSRKLDAGTAAILEEHIKICPACHEFADGQRMVQEALDSWEAAPVSEDFDRRLYQRIEREVSWWDLLLRPVLVRRGVPIAATAALVLVAGLLLDRPAGGPPAAVPVSAQVELAPEQAEHALQEMEMLRDLNRLVRSDSEPRM